MQMIISQSIQQPIHAYMLSYHGKKTTCMYEMTLYMPQVPGQPPTQHPMQVPMGNQYRVSPDSHLTTCSLCDIYLIVSVFLGNINFRGLTAGLLHPPTFFGLSLMDMLFNQVFRLFTRGGVYPLLATPDTIRFPFSFNIVELNWTLSHSQAHTIQHQTQCQISIMYTHPCNVVL